MPKDKLPLTLIVSTMENSVAPSFANFSRETWWAAKVMLPRNSIV